MALINIENGAVARSSVLNDNFVYLEEQLSRSATELNAKINAVVNNSNTVTSNLAEIKTSIGTINNSISSINTAVDAKASVNLNNVSPDSSFKALIVDYVAPNYSGGYSVSSGFVAPKAGWVACYGTSGEGSYTAWFINGQEVFKDDQSWGGGRAGGQGSRSMAFMPAGSSLTKAGIDGSAMFYPCKGV